MHLPNLLSRPIARIRGDEIVRTELVEIGFDWPEPKPRIEMVRTSLIGRASSLNQSAENEQSKQTIRSRRLSRVGATDSRSHNMTISSSIM